MDAGSDLGLAAKGLAMDLETLAAVFLLSSFLTACSFQHGLN